MTKEQYNQLKSELKILAQFLHYDNYNSRAYQSQNAGGKKKPKEIPEQLEKQFKELNISPWRAHYEYRHKHIFMSLQRGKKREQIERPRQGNEPDENYIKKLVEQYETVEQTVCVSA
jgi:hypothetical protein